MAVTNWLPFAEDSARGRGVAERASRCVRADARRFAGHEGLRLQIGDIADDGLVDLGSLVDGDVEYGEVTAQVVVGDLAVKPRPGHEGRAPTRGLVVADRA